MRSCRRLSPAEVALPRRNGVDNEVIALVRRYDRVNSRSSSAAVKLDSRIAIQSGTGSRRSAHWGARSEDGKNLRTTQFGLRLNRSAGDR